MKKTLKNTLIITLITFTYIKCDNANNKVTGTSDVLTAPKLIYPLNNAVDVKTDTSFIWNKVNILSNITVKYSIYLSTVNPPVDKVSSSQGDTLFKPTLVLNTTYYWKIAAEDGNGNVLESEVRSFKTIAPPSVPVLTSPANNATNISLNTSLIWNASTSSNGLNVKYNVYFGTTNPPLTKVSSLRIENTVNTPTLSLNTTYYWKIEAVDGNGGVKESEVWSFKTIIELPWSNPSNSKEDGTGTSFTWGVRGNGLYKSDGTTVGDWNSDNIQLTADANNPIGIAGKGKIYKWFGTVKLKNTGNFNFRRSDDTKVVVPGNSTKSGPNANEWGDGANFEYRGIDGKKFDIVLSFDDASGIYDIKITTSAKQDNINIIADGLYLTGTATRTQEVSSTSNYFNDVLKLYSADYKAAPLSSSHQTFIYLNVGKLYISKYLNNVETRFGSNNMADSSYEVTGKASVLAKADVDDADVRITYQSGDYSENGGDITINNAGLYHVIIITAPISKIFVIPVKHISLIGSATEAGWDESKDISLNLVASASSILAKKSGVAFRQGDFKFRYNYGWDINYRTVLKGIDNANPKGVDDELWLLTNWGAKDYAGTIIQQGGERGNLKITKVEEGIYDLEFTFSQSNGVVSYTKTKTGDLPWENPSNTLADGSGTPHTWGVIGDGMYKSDGITAGSWDNDNVLLTADPTNPVGTAGKGKIYKWFGTVKLKNTGAFKFRRNADWNLNIGSGNSTKSGANANDWAGSDNFEYRGVNGQKYNVVLIYDDALGTYDVEITRTN